jgi:hypothetical protein
MGIMQRIGALRRLWKFGPTAAALTIFFLVSTAVGSTLVIFKVDDC